MKTLGSESRPGGEPARGAGSAPAPALLVSGLPLGRRSSFSRQLELLAAFLGRRGRQALVVGPEAVASAPADGASAPADGTSAPADGASALLLLGYPDQFDLPAGDAGPPVFLWAQLSRPAAPPPAWPSGRVTAVPLTARSGEHLRAGGWPRVGPVVPHGVDTRLLAPSRPEARAESRARLGLQGAFVAGTVGAHSARKRFDLILAAFALFRAARPEAVLLLKTDRVVSLDGADLGALAARRGLPAAAVRILTGELTEEEMARLYGAMDVYINLSEWEGFCLPVVEAMACGVPVVTHAIQGPGEIVPYRELLVPGGHPVREGRTLLLHADPRAAAGVLARAAEQPRLLRELAARGRRAALRRYDMPRVAGTWGRLLFREG